MALTCYEPFWSLIGKQYLSYETDYKWGAWLNDRPIIYLLLPKTEEWHLSRDADYVRYAMWIYQHGLFRFLRRLPVLNRLAFRQTDLE